MPPIRLCGDAAWSWFTDPRAVRHGDTTLIGFVTKNGDVDIGTFDHRSRLFRTHRLSKGLSPNDHANPALLRRTDGRILAFYSAHNGPHLLYRMSVRPDDTTEWLPESRAPDDGAGRFGVTYPNPVQFADEPDRIYLFWRGGDWNPKLAISDDGGLTWGQATALLRAQGRPYLKVFGDGRSTIHIAYSDGHPAEESTNRIHYLAYRAGGFYRADGSMVGTIDNLPLDLDDGDTVYEPAAGENGPGWIWDVAADDAGLPVLAIASILDRDKHSYHYARFDGSEWKVREVAEGGGTIQGEEEPAYSAGMAIDQGNPDRLFVARQIDGSILLESLTTPDGGVTWDRETVARSTADEKILRPMVVRDHDGKDLVVVWMRGRYGHYQDYETELWGWPNGSEATRAGETRVSD